MWRPTEVEKKTRALKIKKQCVQIETSLQNTRLYSNYRDAFASEISPHIVKQSIKWTMQSYSHSFAIFANVFFINFFLVWSAFFVYLPTMNGRAHKLIKNVCTLVSCQWLMHTDAVEVFCLFRTSLIIHNYVIFLGVIQFARQKWTRGPKHTNYFNGIPPNDIPIFNGIGCELCRLNVIFQVFPNRFELPLISCWM